MNLSKDELQEIMSLVGDIIDAAEMKGYNSHPQFEAEFELRLGKAVQKLEILLQAGASI